MGQSVISNINQFIKKHIDFIEAMRSAKVHFKNVSKYAKWLNENEKAEDAFAHYQTYWNDEVFDEAKSELGYNSSIRSFERMDELVRAVSNNKELRDAVYSTEVNDYASTPILVKHFGCRMI